MNNQEVYIISDSDEVYLGTVGELTGQSESTGGPGISLSAMISDIVSDLVSLASSSDEESVAKVYFIQIRPPRQ